MTTLQPHELVQEFNQHRFSLNETLEKMLNEHHSHQTERRGCGYTQASRYLADYINRPRTPDSSDDLRLFRDWQSLGQLTAVAGSSTEQESARQLPENETAGLGVPVKTTNTLRQRMQPVFELFRRDTDASWQDRLQLIPNLMQREESLLLAQMIVDIVLPVTGCSQDTVVLQSYPEKLAIGSCPLAEKYFLELAHGHVKRHGLMNIIIDDDGRPLIVEKMNLGDNHSCLSLVPLVMNGVQLPPGSLLGVDYDSHVLQKTERKLIPGHQIRLADCHGFRFLRLTTLAVTPANRARAFTTHFAAQQAGGLFAPESTRLAELEQITQTELNHAQRHANPNNKYSAKKKSGNLDNRVSTGDAAV
jgi:hypothetical protein